VSTVVQNVNLYLPEFRKKKHWLDGEKMVLVAGASIALLIVVSLFEYVQLVQLRSDLAATESEYQQVAAATVALLDQYGAQTEDPALLENIQKLQDDLQSKQALLQFLEGRELGNATGFSEHLSDLSRYHIPGLSLSQISLTNGGKSVEFGGQVVKADLVPAYLESLSQGTTYAGTDFELVDIQSEPVELEVAEGTSVLDLWNFTVRSLNP
jgi:hypothetical protein